MRKNLMISYHIIIKLKLGFLLFFFFTLSFTKLETWLEWNHLSSVDSKAKQNLKNWELSDQMNRMKLTYKDAITGTLFKLRVSQNFTKMLNNQIKHGYGVQRKKGLGKPF